MGRMKDQFYREQEAAGATDALFTYWEGEPATADDVFQIPQPSQLTAADRAAIDAIDWFPVATDAIASDVMTAEAMVGVEAEVIETTRDADVIRFAEGGYDAARSIRRSEVTGAELVIELRYGIRDGDEFFFATLTPLGFADDCQTEKTTVCVMPTLKASFDRAVADYDGVLMCRATFNA